MCGTLAVTNSEPLKVNVSLSSQKLGGEQELLLTSHGCAHPGMIPSRVSGKAN